MSQNTNRVPPSPVLPLAPLEYDVQFFNSMIRILNYFIQQVNNPGVGIYSRVEVNDGDPDGADIIMDSKQNNIDQTYIYIKELPTSSAGLVTGQVWNDAGTLKISP